MEMEMGVNDFSNWSVCHGLRRDAFEHLPLSDRRKLLRLMARIAEKSYRRGFQHGVEIGDRRTIDPATLRFERSLDSSPWTDSPQKTTAIERLLCPQERTHEIEDYDRGGQG
jgi:hypothetical protein